MKLTDMFQPLPGDTRDQLVSKMEVLLFEMKRWAKDGYEHEPEDCKGAQKVRARWARRSDEFEALLQQLRELPRDYRYQMKDVE